MSFFFFLSLLRSGGETSVVSLYADYLPCSVWFCILVRFFSFARSLVWAFARLFVRSFVRSLVRSFALSLALSLSVHSTPLRLLVRPLCLYISAVTTPSGGSASAYSLPPFVLLACFFVLSLRVSPFVSFSLSFSITSCFLDSFAQQFAPFAPLLADHPSLPAATRRNPAPKTPPASATSR